MEIDVTAFERQKYNSQDKNSSLGSWRSKQCFLNVVGRRGSDTLVKIIHKHVEIGTTSMRRKSKGYNALEQYGYNQLTVAIHSFICPNNSNVHTQMTES